MDNIVTNVLPRLRSAGVQQEDIDQMMVANPRRLLHESSPMSGRAARCARESDRRRRSR